MKLVHFRALWAGEKQNGKKERASDKKQSLFWPNGFRNVELRSKLMERTEPGRAGLDVVLMRTVVGLRLRGCYAIYFGNPEGNSPARERH